MLRIFHNTNFDFIKPWRIAVGFTIAFYLAGAAAMARRGGLNYSIEFTGGTLMQLEFPQPPNVGDIRSTVASSGLSRTPRSSSSEATASSRCARRTLRRRLTSTRSHRTSSQGCGRASPRTHLALVRTEIVGPRVGQELKANAVKALLLSLLVTLIFLAFRYDWRFGVAAVIATAHNLAATIAFMALMNLEVSLTVVAAPAHRHRLFAERHDHHLRSCPREPPEGTPRAAALRC